MMDNITNLLLLLLSLCSRCNSKYEDILDKVTNGYCKGDYCAEYGIKVTQPHYFGRGNNDNNHNKDRNSPLKQSFPPQKPPTRTESYTKTLKYFSYDISVKPKNTQKNGSAESSVEIPRSGRHKTINTTRVTIAPHSRRPLGNPKTNRDEILSESSAMTELSDGVLRPGSRLRKSPHAGYDSSSSESEGSGKRGLFGQLETLKPFAKRKRHETTIDLGLTLPEWFQIDYSSSSGSSENVTESSEDDEIKPVYSKLPKKSRQPESHLKRSTLGHLEDSKIQGRLGLPGSSRQRGRLGQLGSLQKRSTPGPPGSYGNSEKPRQQRNSGKKRRMWRLVSPPSRRSRTTRQTKNNGKFGTPSPRIKRFKRTGQTKKIQRK